MGDASSVTCPNYQSRQHSAGSEMSPAAALSRQRSQAQTRRARLRQRPPKPSAAVGHVPIRASSSPPVLTPGLIQTAWRGTNVLPWLCVRRCRLGFTLTNALCLEKLFRLGLCFQPGHKQSLGPTGGRISGCDRTRLPAAFWAAWKGKSIDLLLGKT